MEEILNRTSDGSSTAIFLLITYIEIAKLL